MPTALAKGMVDWLVSAEMIELVSKIHEGASVFDAVQKLLDFLIAAMREGKQAAVETIEEAEDESVMDKLMQFSFTLYFHTALTEKCKLSETEASLLLEQLMTAQFDKPSSFLASFGAFPAQLLKLSAFGTEQISEISQKALHQGAGQFQNGKCASFMLRFRPVLTSLTGVIKMCRKALGVNQPKGSFIDQGSFVLHEIVSVTDGILANSDEALSALHEAFAEQINDRCHFSLIFLSSLSDVSLISLTFLSRIRL